MIVAPAPLQAVATASVTGSSTIATATVSGTIVASIEELDEELAAEDDEGAIEEVESRVATTTITGYRYTLDLSDDDLLAKWKAKPEELGSIAIGFADEGRVINSQQCPAGDGKSWTVVSPEKTWGTAETVGYVLAAIQHVLELHPNAPPLRINQMSGREGGYLRPHRSHQNGRDVDLAFYYPTAEVVRTRNREKAIDVAMNWELIKALITLTDVEVIWVDRRIIAVLYDYATKAGEDRAWLDSIFKPTDRRPLIQHARRHRDHFHVRFYNGRAQELGRRVAPLLAQRPDQNTAMVRVKSGDNLGAIALRYNSGVSAIQKANHMRNTFIRIGQVLRVPMRGPCTRCPIPPPIEVPQRRLPPPPPPQLSAPLTATATTAELGASLL